MIQSPRARKAASATALAIAIAGPAEGLRRWAYYCPAGILTTCYGHTGADVKKGVEYSLEQCTALLNDDMALAVRTVQNCAPDMPMEILASFADAVLNLGRIIACDTKNSTAAKYLQASQWEAACNQLPRWNRARVLGVLIELPGLTTRRANEKALCLIGAAKAAASPLPIVGRL